MKSLLGFLHNKYRLAAILILAVGLLGAQSAQAGRGHRFAGHSWNCKKHADTLAARIHGNAWVIITDISGARCRHVFVKRGRRVRCVALQVRLRTPHPGCFMYFPACGAKVWLPWARVPRTRC